MTGHLLMFLYLTVLVAADDNTTSPTYMSSDELRDVVVPTNCTVDFNETDVEFYRELTKDNDNKLVYVHFRFINHPGKLLHENQGDWFEPLDWVYVSGKQGKSLLSLLQQYEALSLQTMSIGVGHVTIKIAESTEGCLSNQPMSVLGPYFRDALLNDFEPSAYWSITNSSKEPPEKSTTVSVNVQVCHMTIASDDNVAIFHYTCCHINKHGLPICDELKVDSNMQIVKIFITIINILVIIFCPLLVPEYYYSDTKGSIRYKQDSNSEREPMTILKTTVPKKAVSRNNVVTDELVHKYMPHFSKSVKKLKAEKSAECDIGTIEFIVKSRDLISEDDVPVGIFSTLYNSFVRCEIRKHDSMSKCCNADMLRVCGCTVHWHECLSRLITTILLIIVSVPWIIRVLFYVVYEQDHFGGRARAAEARQLDNPYTANISLYLSPVHVVFLLCYFLIIIEGMCLGMLNRTVTQSLRILFRECFQDMRSSLHFKSVSPLLNLLLYPCTKYGIFGLVLFPLVWAFVLPALLVVATFHYLPLVNITIRLFASLCRNIFPSNIATGGCIALPTLDREKMETGPSLGVKCLRKLRHVLLIVFCLLALYSFLFLLVEFVLFVVVIAIYTLMGIILNSSFMMQYVPLLFMVAVYGKTTFAKVYKKYMNFNKIIHKHTMDIFKKSCSSAQSELMSSDVNTAFEISTEVTENCSKDFVFIKNSRILWSSKRTMLFVDKHGTPYIRKKFFLQCCEMDHYAAPGSLGFNLLKAVFSFLLIVCFLVFVGLVVVAFSNDLKLSITNQTLIALAGGLIPFVLSNFLFREEELPKVKDDFRFTRCLNKIISRYQEKFDVTDFICPRIRYDDTNTDIDSITQDDVIELDKITPKNAGTNGHAIKPETDMDLPSGTLQDSSPGFDTVCQYSDESSGHLLEKDEKPIEQAIDTIDQTSLGKNQTIEQTIKSNGGDSSCEQESRLINGKTEDCTDMEDQNSCDSQSTSTSSVVKIVKVTRDLQSYNLVVDTSRQKTATQYLASII